MDNIKVCHIITKLELGGAQQNTIYTVRHLNPQKFAPILISGRGGILDREVSNLTNVKVYLTPYLARPINPFYDFLAFIKLFLILMKEKPLIVHTHSSKGGIIGRWAAFFANVPVIIHTYHGFGFNDFQKSAVKLLFIMLERLTARISMKLIAVTDEDIKKGLKHHIGNKQQYELIRSGIEISKYKNLKINVENKKKELGITPNEKVITTIAPLKPQKNLPDFIRVAKEVLACEPLCKFLIIGDGGQRKLLEDLTYEFNIQDKVKFLGWRRDIPEILAISDIFVLTSLWEGLPRSIIEAMCCAVPVVANGVDGVREIIKDNETGFLVEPFKTDKMSEKIIQLFGDTTLARKIGQNGRNSINEQFDIDFMIKQQEELYLKIKSTSTL